MTRAEAARKLCTQLAEEVEAVAPPGIGHRPETWETVGSADAQFMIALTAWESTGTEEARALVRAAYTRVLEAWHEAVREFESQREPTS